VYSYHLSSLLDHLVCSFLNLNMSLTDHYDWLELLFLKRFQKTIIMLYENKLIKRAVFALEFSKH